MALSPAELAALKKELTAAKKKAKALEQTFMAELLQARAQLSTDDDQDLALRIVLANLKTHLDDFTSKHRRLVTSALENWWTSTQSP